MEAQSITQGISDSQVRAIALGKVLDHLLGASPTSSNPAIETSPTEGMPSHGASTPKSKEGPTTWVEDLAREGFFATPRSLADVTEKVRAGGHNVLSKNVTEPLEKLVAVKRLRRERKPKEGQKRGVWMYSN
jgi:hypothetical protein